MLACGGTAGHVHPALAVAEAWKRLDPRAELSFAGADGGLEERLVGTAGAEFVGIRSAPFFGVGYGAKARALARLVVGVREARRVLRRLGSDVVVGFGGYAAAPFILAAASLRIPVLVHESNASVGLANRLVAPFARRVLLGFEATVPHVRRPVTVTGVPVGPAIVQAAARRTAGGPTTPWRILVTGGTYGSRLLDERAPAVLGRIAAAGHPLAVQHLAGEGDVAAIRAAYDAAGVAAEVRGFVDGMASTFVWADFAFTSAGAVTLAEIAVAGVPALVVPQAQVALDHQTGNARAFAAVTGARWIGEQDWEPADVAAHVASVLGTPGAWSAASAGMRRFARPDAGELVVRACAPYLDTGV